MNWYLKALKNYANFSGRARRREYWWFVLFNILISMGVSIIAKIFGDEYLLSLLYSLFMFPSQPGISRAS